MSVQRIVLTTTSFLPSFGYPLFVGPRSYTFIGPSSSRKKWRKQERSLFSAASNADIIAQRRRTECNDNNATNTASMDNGVVSMNEISLSLNDGMCLKGQHFCYKKKYKNNNKCKIKEKELLKRSLTKIEQGQSTTTATATSTTTKTKLKILAIHGWLDNCRSFHLLGPRLIEKFKCDAELVAIDLPGHGWSSHRPIDGPSTILSEGTYYIAEILHELGWGNDSNNDYDNDDGNDSKENSNIALIGHSMGGGIAITYGGVFPNQISGIVSIDIYGPEPAKPEDIAFSIRNHVTQRRLSGPGGRGHALYPTLERCIKARQKSAEKAPGGHQNISLEAATELVTRATIAVYNKYSSSADNDVDNDIPVGYKFRHDTRLLWPSLQYFTPDQIESILEEVKCPVCIIAAEDGYPFPKDRIERVIQNLRPAVHKILPGSHHLHADPGKVDAVVDTIYDFLK